MIAHGNNPHLSDPETVKDINFLSSDDNAMELLRAVCHPPSQESIVSELERLSLGKHAAEEVKAKAQPKEMPTGKTKATEPKTGNPSGAGESSGKQKERKPDGEEESD